VVDEFEDVSLEEAVEDYPFPKPPEEARLPGLRTPDGKAFDNNIKEEAKVWNEKDDEDLLNTSNARSIPQPQPGIP